MTRVPTAPVRFLLLLVLLASGCAKPAHPGDPIAGLTPDQLERFRRGRAVFDSVFTPEGGLGPLFNSSACGECHEDPVSGGSGDEIEVHATAFRVDGNCDPLGAARSAQARQELLDDVLGLVLALEIQPE